MMSFEVFQAQLFTQIKHISEQFVKKERNYDVSGIEYSHAFHEC